MLPLPLFHLTSPSPYFVYLLKPIISSFYCLVSHFFRNCTFCIFLGAVIFYSLQICISMVTNNCRSQFILGYLEIFSVNAINPKLFNLDSARFFGRARAENCHIFMKISEQSLTHLQIFFSEMT